MTVSPMVRLRKVDNRRQPIAAGRCCSRAACVKPLLQPLNMAVCADGVAFNAHVQDPDNVDRLWAGG
jgi:hypothetical protein